MKPKFRVWGNIGKEFIDYCDVRMELTTGRIYAGDMNYPGAMIDITDGVVLMQSTGLKDKNGVEIYEGDIVIAWSQGVKGTFEIKRRIDGLWLLYPAWKDGQFWYLTPTEDGRETVEVIGNIYENPELMEMAE